MTRLRRIAPVPWREREEPNSQRPDEIRLRSYETNWRETRYVVESLSAGRLLGDKQFSARADALEFARIAAGWDNAKLTDCTAGARR